MSPFPLLPPTPTGRPRWTRDAWEFLENAGLLQGKYEILDGEILFKMPQNYPHTAAINRFFAYAIRLVNGDLDRVRSQTNFNIRGEDGNTSHPEPDMVVLRDPQDGNFQRREEFAKTDSVSPEFAPDDKVTLSELLPPQENEI